MTRREHVTEKSRSAKEPYRSPAIREYGTVRELTRNTFNPGAGDSPVIFDQAS